MPHRQFMLAGAAVLALAACGDGEEVLQNNLVAGEPVTNEAAALVPVAANPIEYANLVAAADQYEMQAAEMAIDNAENAEVRALAETIRDDHRRSTELLQQMASQSDPPITPDPTLLPQQERDLEALRGASGAEFDRLWLLQQIAAHEKSFAMVRDYAENAQDGAMQQHARQIVEPLGAHLAHARQLAEQMKAQQ